MKRSTLALAAFAACSNLAQAADGVTISGGVDGNVTRVTATGRGGDVWQVRDGGMYSTKLSFSGVEELGGGYKADFFLESQSSSDTGQGVATNSNNFFSGTPSGASGLTWNRKATVSLHTPVGELRLGRDYVSTFVPATYFDPFFSAGVASAVNYQPYYKYVFSPFAPTTVNFLLAPGTLVRASNMLGYYIPARWVPGLYAYAQTALSEGVGPRFTGIGAGYYTSTYFVAGAWGKTKNPLGDAAAYMTAPTAASNNNLNVWSVGASYKLFGQFTVMGFYHSQTFDKYGELLVASPVTEDNREVADALLGFSWAIGSHTIKASVMQRNDKGLANADSSQAGLGYSYHFSKRTAVYANYVNISNKNSANYSFAAAGVTPSNGGKATALQAGVSHNF